MQKVEIHGYIVKGKRISIIAIFCVAILLTVQWQESVPISRTVFAIDEDGDGIDDMSENMSFYKYYETDDTLYFNSAPGTNEETEWAEHDFWMNIIRPKYKFIAYVSQLNGNSNLYINIGNSSDTQMNESISITGVGTVMSELLPGDPDNIESGNLRVRLCSDGNFTLTNFKMESNSAWNESDTDSDGLNDGEEDLDKNGLTESTETSPLMADTDEDDLSDGDEATYSCDPLDPDTDDDGLTDGEEVYIYSTTPSDSDYDNDLLNDGFEVNVLQTSPILSDTDGDNLTDYEENNETYSYKTNPLLVDHDGDGLWDGDEVLNLGTNPLLQDTDGDNLTDWDEIHTYSTNATNKDADKDGDGLPDCYEIITSETDHDDEDTDGDGLWDGYDGQNHYGELTTYNVTIHGETFSIDATDPNDDDTDGDGLSDYFERITGWNVTVDGEAYHVTSNPNRRISNPSHGSVDYSSGMFYDDLYDHDHMTDPWLRDTDNDGYYDTEEKVIFRTNAENGIYATSGVWISVCSSNRDAHILTSYDYDSTITHRYDNTIASKVRTHDGIAVYFEYNTTTEEKYLLIFPNITNRTFSEETAWKFSYSSDNSWNINTKLNGTKSYKFVKSNVSGYDEVWLNSTISDMDSDGLKDYLERETDPLNCDTDGDSLSDYIEREYDTWYYWDTYSKYENGTYFNEYLSPLVADADGDSLKDGEEIGVSFRSNSLDGVYDQDSWIAINNGSVLYTSSLWMSQFSGYGEYNASIRQSISENYSQMTGYGYAGQYSGFSSVDELGYFLFNNSFGHAVFAKNFSTIFIDSNATDGTAMKFNLSASAASNANLTPFPVAIYGRSEIINISLWTNPFCTDSDGDDISDYSEITTYGTYALDSDPDEDGLNDYYEVNYNSTDQGYSPFEGTSNETDLNPFSPDTDGDGLWDGKRIMNGNVTVHIGEISYAPGVSNTDPLCNDTDGDGLLDGYSDGGEKVAFTYTADSIVPVVEGETATCWINDTNARDGGNGGYGYLGYMNVTLNVFVAYNESEDLNLTLGCVWENGTTTVFDSWNIPNVLGPDNSTYYVSYTLFDKMNHVHNWADVLSLGSSNWLDGPIALGNWYVNVSDDQQDGSVAGTIQRFEMSVEYRTNPRTNDSDEDGLSDLEECTFGDYGWITNPWDWDTDLDLLSDRDEVTGMGDAWKCSSPVNSDTDGDGTEDGMDLDPMGNAYFLFNFSRIEVLDGCRDDDMDNDDVEIYPVITHYLGCPFENREGFTVPHKSGIGYQIVSLTAGNGQSWTETDGSNWTIVFDVPDYYSIDSYEKWFYLRAYEEDGTNADDLLLLNSTANDSGTYGFAYNITTGGTQSFVTDVQTGTDAQMWFNVTYDTLSKVNTQLILPTNDTCSMNATSGDETLRFTAPDMSFTIFLLNVSGSGSSPYVESGMNTIHVPIPVFFESKFWNVTNSAASADALPSHFQSASWTMYNDTSVTNSISFVITMNCSFTDATDLINDYLLTNASGIRTSWIVDVSDSISTIGLPKDIVTFTPTAFTQSTKWAGPGENASSEDTPWKFGNIAAACAIGTIVVNQVSEVTGIDLHHVFMEGLDFFASGLEAIGAWCLGAAKDPRGALHDIVSNTNLIMNHIVHWIASQISEQILNQMRNVGMDKDSGDFEGIYPIFSNLVNTINVISDGSQQTESERVSMERAELSFMLPFISDLDNNPKGKMLLDNAVKFLPYMSGEFLIKIIAAIFKELSLGGIGPFSEILKLVSLKNDCIATVMLALVKLLIGKENSLLSQFVNTSDEIDIGDLEPINVSAYSSSRLSELTESEESETWFDEFIDGVNIEIGKFTDATTQWTWSQLALIFVVIPIIAFIFGKKSAICAAIVNIATKNKLVYGGLLCFISKVATQVLIHGLEHFNEDSLKYHAIKYSIPITWVLGFFGSALFTMGVWEKTQYLPITAITALTLIYDLCVFDQVIEAV